MVNETKTSTTDPFFRNLIIAVVFVSLIIVISNSVSDATSESEITFTVTTIDAEDSFSSEGGVLNVNNIFDENDNTFGRVRT